MVYPIILIFFIYFILLATLIVGFHRALGIKTETNTSPHFISVVVAVRNEEQVIQNLLHDLAVQDYPSFEVIVVNDHSNDQTTKVVNAFCEVDNRFKIFDNKGAGKKKALTLGIAMAKGEIIATTDADCTLSSQWLTNINSHFYGHVQMVFGPVSFTVINFFSHLQGIEFAGLIGSGISTYALGYPTMCNAANLAFKKSAFEAVDGYSGNMHVPSGDDEFLMRKIIAQFSQGALAFAEQKLSIVKTLPAPTIKHFVSQRLRWAGKWRHNSSRYTKGLAIFVVLVQLNFLMSFIMLLNGLFFNLLAVLLIARLLFEGYFLSKVSRYLNQPFNLVAFLLLQIVYPLTVVFIGIGSNFISYAWKGRRS